jgi:glycosyltransferase involved in cell wall biosynthesis
VSRAIESVLDQTYCNFRLTLLENGSTDRSWQIIDLYRKYPRISIIHCMKNMKSEMGRTR